MSARRAIWPRPLAASERPFVACTNSHQVITPRKGHDLSASDLTYVMGREKMRGVTEHGSFRQRRVRETRLYFSDENSSCVAEHGPSPEV